MKLIKLSSDHYIIVDKLQIKKGDWFLMNGSIIRQCDYVNEYMLVDTTQGKHHISVCDKITYSTDIHFNGVYYVPLSEVNELFSDLNVEKKAKYHYDIMYFMAKSDDIKPYVIRDYKAGYNQALEDNKDMKYTEKDVIAIVEKSRATGLTAEYIIQSLQPPTSWDVEFVNGKLKIV